MQHKPSSSNGNSGTPDPKNKKNTKENEKVVPPVSDDPDEIQGFGSDEKLFGPENGD